MGSNIIQRKLTDEHGYVNRLTTNNQSHIDNATDIFFRILGRPPRPEELRTAVDFLESEEEDRADTYRSLIWSLLATNEFLFNR